MSFICGKGIPLSVTSSIIVFFCRTISPNKKIVEDEKSLITESEQEKSIDFPRLLKQEIEEKTTTN